MLNQPQFRDAPILLAGENFGCGSSREGAVWALKYSGIRCVIAPSFGDIFAKNCYQNFVLPVVLPAEQRETIVLFELEGWQVDEIAALHKVSPSAVKSRLARGRDRLRAYYQKQFASEARPAFAGGGRTSR